MNWICIVLANGIAENNSNSTTLNIKTDFGFPVQCNPLL